MYPEKGNVRTQELAQKERIPIKFLEHILLVLTNGGILQSRRGVGGGYALTRPAEQIRLGEVIRLTEGPLNLVNCNEETTQESCSCIDEETCGLRDVLQDISTAFAEIVDGVSLADVCERTHDLQRQKAHTAFYNI